MKGTEVGEVPAPVEATGRKIEDPEALTTAQASGYLAVQEARREGHEKAMVTDGGLWGRMGD